MRRGENLLPDDIDIRLEDTQLVLEGDSRVIFVYLFGGLESGRRSPLSDVDIAVYLDSNVDISSTKLDLIGMITDALATDELDLIILNETPLSLAGRIQKSAKILVDKSPSRRYDYESLIRRQFADFQIKEAAILRQRFGING
ncbi:MAG: nucleotidyltransferase domain-containing protein [Candidatus Contendobacter sp.]|nr:nucleotidyltransferase domain-containing protein [Candidatus Contendobacter sp.]